MEEAIKIKKLPVLLFLSMFLIGQEKERANSFGSVGLGNIPTARFFSEGTVALNFSRHELFSRGN